MVEILKLQYASTFFLKGRSTGPHSQEFRAAWSPEIHILTNPSNDSEQEACGPLVEISSCASQSVSIIHKDQGPQGTLPTQPKS